MLLSQCLFPTRSFHLHRGSLDCSLPKCPPSQLILGGSTKVATSATSRKGVAHDVVHALVKVLVPDCPPVFTSHGLRLYFYSLTTHFGSWIETIGRQTPQWRFRAELLYGQLTEHYRRRRLVRVERRALLGSLDPPGA
jgi:hypothetical protein